MFMRRLMSTAALAGDNVKPHSLVSINSPQARRCHRTEMWARTPSTGDLPEAPVSQRELSRKLAISIDSVSGTSAACPCPPPTVTSPRMSFMSIFAADITEDTCNFSPRKTSCKVSRQLTALGSFNYISMK